jgi:hypothetical protein
MRGLSSIIIGLALFGVGMWIYVETGFGMTMLMFAVGGAVLFVRGCYGMDVASANDVTAPMEFISNPAEAIVDAAVDRFGEYVTDKRKAAADKRKAEAEPVSTFDPDAVIAKYLENRPAPPVAAMQAPQQARGFGRKGLQG